MKTCSCTKSGNGFKGILPVGGISGVAGDAVAYEMYLPQAPVLRGPISVALPFLL